MFSVVHDSPQAIWCPIEKDATLYVGGMAGQDMQNIATHEGLEMLPLSASLWNSHYDIPFGVIIGTNNRRPLYSGTGGIKTEYIAWSTPHDSTNEFVLTDGPYINGGRQPFVKVDLVDPTTVLRVNLVDDTDTAAPVAPVVGTVTTGSEAGTGCTTSAMSVASVPGYSTIYFRTGANKGAYRMVYSTHATIHTWYTPTYADVATDDTCVLVNMPLFGIGAAQLSNYSLSFDINAAVGSYAYQINVIRLDLAEADKEYVEFQWAATNWLPTATGRA